MSFSNENIRPLEMGYLNGAASQTMQVSLGKDGNPTIEDLAQTATWKGKVIQWFRGLVGKEITAEQNTKRLRETYGEIDGLAKDEEGVMNLNEIRVQMRGMVGRLDNTDQKLEKSIKAYHWANPKDSSKELKILEKNTAKLANATALLCHECLEGSKKTNSFVGEMQENTNAFSTASLVIRDLRTKIEESENVVGKLRKLEKKEGLVKGKDPEKQEKLARENVKELKNKLINDPKLYADFLKFHSKAEKVKDSEASAFMELLTPYASKEDNITLAESFKDFVNSISKKLIEETDVGRRSEIAARVRSYKI